MDESIIENVLSGQLNPQLLIKWLINEYIEDIPEDCILLCCSRIEFTGHFLAFIRSQTDGNSLQVLQKQNTPEKLLNSQRHHHRSISDPTNELERNENSSVKSDRRRSHESPNREQKKRIRVKTKLFSEDKSKESISSDESRLSIGVEKLVLCSTPLKNGVKPDYPNLLSPVTPTRYKDYERCDTPRLGRHSRSQDKSISFGDYLVSAQKSTKKKRSKNVSNELEDSKMELDISNSEMFPEIGMNRSFKKRINPTNIDSSMSQKSFSLNSFNSECFQQPSPLALEENAAFKQQKIQPKEFANSFEIERKILKQEKEKLREKFNSSTPKVSKTPQIKILQREPVEKHLVYVDADLTKVTFKEKLDLLIEIYDILIKTNLILSFITEIYYLISILLSKQTIQDFTAIECQTKCKFTKYILKSIHNSTYLAVKVLWSQKNVLDIILDKNSLKVLGENKKLRSFYPELAKALLNSYGLKCEEEGKTDKSKLVHESCSNGVIRFNLETDNADNFPSLLSFQNFKKQRDMFYEIFRGYTEMQAVPPRASFRSRIKTLLACGTTPANYTHLAALFVAHMCAECLPTNVQETKLSKLQRRLTCPAAPESNRLPQFTAKEIFYKEFIMYTDSEYFKVHLRDSLACDIVALDGTLLAIEDRSNNSSNIDISKEFLQLSRKLRLISKFLGYLTSLPYNQTPVDSSLKTTTTMASLPAGGSPNQIFTVPKEKVLENDIALRNNSQPTIDLKALLANATETGRLCVTIPWLVQYLSMLDYTSLRIKYYNELILNILDIYYHRLNTTDNKFKKNTVIFLKSTLGWLFDLPHFPQVSQVKKICFNDPMNNEICIDYFDFIDETILFELCPYLKDIGILLSTCKVLKDQKDVGSFRHITPVSLSLNPEERIRNKEKELQARLEEELIKSQPTTTRRVIEVVIERVWRDVVRSLSGDTLMSARVRARDNAAIAVRNRKGDQNLLAILQGVYKEQLQQVRDAALEAARACIMQRTVSALTALLPSAPQPLQAVAAKSCFTKVTTWINDNWKTTAVLCKDIESEMRTLLALGDAVDAPKTLINVDTTLSGPEFDAVHPSPATAVINLKEAICLLLDYEDPPDLNPLLDICAACCSPRNMFCRPPTLRAILQLSVDLCIICVSRRPKQITQEFLNKLHVIWNICCPDRGNIAQESEAERRNISPELRNFDAEDRAPTPVTDDEEKPENKSVKSDMNCYSETKCVKDNNSFKSPGSSLNDTKVEDNSDTLGFFDRVLCPRNIVLLSNSKCDSGDIWQAMATMLVFLLNHNYLSEESLTEQCLSVYTQDWSQIVQKNLSICMQSVSMKWSNYSMGKFSLILDFMAEYCTDMDYEPSD